MLHLTAATQGGNRGGNSIRTTHMQHTRRLSLCELGEHSLENQQKICQKHVQAEEEGEWQWQENVGGDYDDI